MTPPSSIYILEGELGRYFVEADLPVVVSSSLQANLDIMDVSLQGDIPLGFYYLS